MPDLRPALVDDASVRMAYAHDASGLELVPAAIARPTSEEEVRALLADATRTRTTVTAAGSQTSTTGASVTDGGLLLSLAAMRGVIDVDVERRIAIVEPGVIVGDLNRELASTGLMFAPDPTSENEATIGGAIACNASGARTLLYGPTRRHVIGLRVALADGSVHDFRRPTLEKNTVGYAFAQDPIDWFVGSEGTLGVVVRAELALLPRPERVTGIGVPFPDDRSALAFVIGARASTRLAPRCLEFFDGRALDLVRHAADDPAWGGEAGALVYLEDASDDPPLDDWLALAEAHDASVGDMRVYDTDAAIREVRRLRHAVPSTTIERGHAARPAGGRRVSTDWAVPYPRLLEAVTHAHAIAEAHGVERSITYGHAGNGHPHQNWVARDRDELVRLEAVVEETLRWVVAAGGTVAAEHGIGKIKRRWIDLQMTPLQLGAMRALKRELDPLGLLAPGNVL